MKKINLLLLSIYLIVGITCSITNVESFKKAISTYNLVQQIDELKYYEHGKILTSKPNLTNSERKEYQTLKIIAEATTFLKYVNSDSSLTSLLAKGFAFTLPFVIVLLLIRKRKRVMWIIAALLVVYLLSSILVSISKGKAEKEVTKYFEVKKAEELNKMFNLDR